MFTVKQEYYRSVITTSVGIYLGAVAKVVAERGEVVVEGGLLHLLLPLQQVRISKML
jgi:hypothetical protein